MELSFEVPPPPPPPPPPQVFAEHWTQVGAGIKVLREARGMTQAELARLVGVERTSITNIEKGRQRLGLDLLDKIATALGMKLTMRLEPLEYQETLAKLQGKCRFPDCKCRMPPGPDPWVCELGLPQDGVHVLHFEKTIRPNGRPRPAGD